MNVKNTEGLKRLVFYKELANVVALLNERKILFLFIKGLPLSILLYEDNTKRLYSDIDLFISKKDLCPTISSLSALGFINVRGWIPKEVSKQITLRKIVYGIPIDIDLHYELTQFKTINDTLDFNSIYKQSIEFSFGNCVCKTMPYNIALDFSIYHLKLERMRGNLETFKWEKDIELLIKKLKFVPFVNNLTITEFIDLNKKRQKYSYFLFRLLECRRKLTFLKESLFPPKSELSYSGKYKTRLHRLLGIENEKN
ncbi:nucleotidyltransferase family protein [Alteromonas sp. NFXS44]|uniref:nucleotidyltransferase family protein n=1 Tax=Alteromonas sp. NFXS44 TaxID=2818435 RepID=UPI0032DF5BC8